MLTNTALRFKCVNKPPKNEWNSENRVSFNYITSWMNFQVHARSLVELVQEIVPMRVEMTKKLFVFLRVNFITDNEILKEYTVARS